MVALAAVTALPALKIDWAKMPTYNTIMAVAAGVGLFSLVQFGRELVGAPDRVSTDGWALNFGVLGLILTMTGLHMTLTWPLAAGGFPFDNIIFGETSLGFGVLLLAAAVYLWWRASLISESRQLVQGWARVARPVSAFVGFMGLALIATAIAGVKYQLFAAPPQEPISGLFASHPLIEAIFISVLLALVGVGALLFPFALTALLSKGAPTVLFTVIGWCWGIAGVVFAIFGALNYFTHIGLIINTM